jgi:hypothetical protein
MEHLKKLTMEKIEMYVRFSNEGEYYNKINVDPNKISNPRIFTDEVFFNIDGITVVTRKEDWNKIEQWNEN